MDGSLDTVIEIFESKLLTAISEKYGGESEAVRQHLVYENQLVDAMNARMFSNNFLQQTDYPHERLPVLVHYLFDIKLELYFIETDIALSNLNVLLAPGGQGNFTESPRMHLLYLSLEQSVLLKSRIVWERFANFIFYLETGEFLESKRSGSKTKSKVFREFINATPKWSFLLEHADAVTSFDQVFRTPEVHKNSTLRTHFINGTNPDSDELLAVLNIAINLWQGIAAILKGGRVNRGSWSIGMEKLKTRTSKGSSEL